MNRYTHALNDLFTYQMGDGPAGVPRFFIARTWLPEPAAWLMNAMRLAEAVECSGIVRNILVGLSEDQSDDTITDDAARAVFDRLRERVTLLEYDDAHTILDDLGIPLNFIEHAHQSIERIDVIPFTLDTGFGYDIINRYSGLIPIGDE